MHVSPPASRRRADLTAVRRKDDVLLGFNVRGSNRIVDLHACAVLRPDIVALLDPLRGLLKAILKERDPAEIVLTATETGIDMLLNTAAPLGGRGRTALGTFAQTNGLARISRGHPKQRGTEPLATLRAPVVTFGAVPAAIPPGAFLQATAEGEAALAEVVDEGTDGAKRVLDLFAGCGTFALRLAGADRKRTVLAMDSDDTLLEALRGAAKKGMLAKVGVEDRNLLRKPVPADALNRFDAVVLDPPRGGAMNQTEALAASKVERIVYVSCNPITFARDAAQLLAGGYELAAIRPVDQFLWTPHLELAAVFVR
jgi:23S rRNA (uracil1939-C5)-methyltransferase